jgi:hypothetical protein
MIDRLLNDPRLSKLHFLSDSDLEGIRGTGGELDVSVRTHPFQATLGLAYKTPGTTLVGTLSKGESGLEAGITARTHLGRASLEGSFRTGLDGTWSALASVRIPLGH